MLKRYQKQTEPLKTYNKRKLENWERIQMEQLVATYQEMNAEIEEIKEQEGLIRNALLIGNDRVLPELREEYKTLLVQKQALEKEIK